MPLAHNYDRLGYPAAAVTGDARYTRYVDAGHLLRSHARAMIPPALSRLALDPGDDVLLVCPGITYRRDSHRPALHRDPGPAGPQAARSGSPLIPFRKLECARGTDPRWCERALRLQKY